MPLSPGEVHAQDRVRLRHMLDAANRARRFCAGRRPEDLATDDMLLLATVKTIEVVGEASTKVSDATKSRLATINWSEIRRMRNRTIHGYDTVETPIIWDTVQIDLPPLIAALESALAAWPPPEPPA